MKTKIKNILNNPVYNPDYIYYVSKIDNSSGFLLFKNSLWFITKNITNLSSNKTQTQFLKLVTNLPIKANEINANFPDGNYNVIELINFNDENKLEIFIDLCKIFVHQSNFNINEFFNALIDMFKNSSKTEKFNILGFFGELFLIKQIYLEYGLNLSTYWHLVNSNDKHDITLNGLSIEVKTTTKPEMVFLIKHDQIFTTIKVIVALVRIFDLPNGTSIKNLLEFFYNEKGFHDNLDFVLALSTEVLKIKNAEDLNKRFGVNDINYYLSNDLTSINNIPMNITKLVYNYDFSGEKRLSENDLCNNIKGGLT